MHGGLNENVFEAIRESGITAKQAAEHCGIKVNRNSMAVCPFHKDKNLSMKIDRRYCCFGCGEKGDAIDFVANFYEIGKKDAALQIAAAFGISFEDKKGRKPPLKRKRRLSPEQMFERAEEEWNPLFCEALEKRLYRVPVRHFTLRSAIGACPVSGRLWRGSVKD